MRIEFYLEGTETNLDGQHLMVMDGKEMTCPFTIGAKITLEQVVTMPPTGKEIWDVKPLYGKYTILDIQYHAHIQYSSQFPSSGTVSQIITAMVWVKPVATSKKNNDKIQP